MTYVCWLLSLPKLNLDSINGTMWRNRITPYATAYRYPGEVLEPTEDEYQKAFKAAVSFYDFVCSLLPPEVSVP
ncbi:MAG: hypothetical protein HYU84_12050 [Chloroflexi bacterium]|nr:hypothetical protein [Chloroflexota bacterium]